jgi:gluconolactonase
MFKLNHAIRNIFFLLILLANSAAAYEVLQGPTEVRYWDTAKAYNGYTLFGAPGGTYLIDMEGRVVQTWSKVRTNPRFLDNGNILDSSTDDPSRGSGFIEVDWEDNVVWRYTETRSNYAPHHDFVRIFNKKLGAYTTIYIANKSITNEQAIAAGCDPSRNYKDAQMDAIVEVDMDGNIVWEWWFFDHVIQDIDPSKANYVGQGKTIADYPGRININLPGRPLKRDWLHCNSLDYNPQLGHIVTNSVQGEFYVIDHDGTFIPGDPQASINLAAGEAGDFLYRFGDPARYEQGGPPSILEDWTKCANGHKQIGGAHDVQWIDEGLPGAGHFMIFNNGQYMFERTNQSYVFEINGFLNANGHDTGDYVNPPDAGYTKVEFHHDTHKPDKLISNQIVWEYHSKSNQGFFSHIGAGAQRLPNGNTLICSDTEGHFFELTSEAKLVWEYINPMTREYGAVMVMPDSLPMTNSVFRAYRYSADHPALAGRDLTPGDTLTGKEPNYDIPEIEKNMSIHLPKSMPYLITFVAIMGLSEETFDVPEMQIIPGGTFDMGDHHDLGGAEHRNDEVPIHCVTLKSFYISVYEITNQQYCEYLNNVLIQELVSVEDGYVTSTQTGYLLCDTYQSDGYSRIQFDDNEFSVPETMDDHPVVGIRWAGAVTYCNWLSSVMGYQACYDPNTGLCDFTKDGFRLPTEAEWEYAGRGALHNPYAIYPWGDDPDNARANWPNSGDPYEAGSMPYTTPVGFYNGQVHLKTDYKWPGSASSYRTMDGSNGYDLYDMAGNVWEWTNDWYHSDYYSVSPRFNPLGPTTGKPMPDGKIYHVLRSGNWYNGPQGHSRVSNRNPAHFRGPQDPYHPWYHIGFRIARSNTSDTGLTPETVTRSGVQATIIADGFDFAEGPAANSTGELFFSDLQASKIYRLDDKGQTSVFVNNSGGANGLFFDQSGNLIACQGALGRVVSISEERDITVLADNYQGKRFNKPNDLWIDPHGGIYFTDPAYGTKRSQDGEHIYYIDANRTRVTHVINDMVRPNGLIGSPDSQILYVADHGAGKVYVYDINGPGILSNKRLFVSEVCDGMTIDRFGNVYITNESSVLVYNPTGKLIEQIQAEGQVTNVCFGRIGASTLYITSTNTLFAINMQVSGFVPINSP